MAGIITEEGASCFGALAFEIRFSELCSNVAGSNKFRVWVQYGTVVGLASKIYAFRRSTSKHDKFDGAGNALKEST